VSVLASQASLTPYPEEDGLVSVEQDHMDTLMLVFPTRHCLGGVDGEAAGVAAGVVGSAGAGLHPIGTPGIRTINFP